MVSSSNQKRDRVVNIAKHDSKAFFNLKIEGKAVENGEIDVNDLAPAMLSVGDLLQSTNDVTNPDGSRVSVNVKATQLACFEVDFSVIHTAIETTKPLLDFAAENSTDVEAANELADLILKTGTITGAIGGGLFALLRWLKGRKPEKKVPSTVINGDVTLHIGDQTFITNQKTIDLAESVSVREKAAKLASILEREGIDTMEFVRPGQVDTFKMTKADVRAFSVPVMPEEEIDTQTRKMVLQISSLSFKEDNKWKLTDGGEPFFATITDVAFLNKIARSEISFSKNDYLTCTVTETQLNTSQGLKKEREIIEVLEHKPAMKQLKLI